MTKRFACDKKLFQHPLMNPVLAEIDIPAQHMTTLIWTGDYRWLR